MHPATAGPHGDPTASALRVVALRASIVKKWRRKSLESASKLIKISLKNVLLCM
jgi:hypothetical protein